MKTLILDSDVLIDILRGKPETINQVRLHAQDALLYCSVISVGELFAGMRPKEKIQTEKLLDSLISIPVTKSVAKQAGDLKNSTKSHTLWLDDCLIAASALENSLTLLTKNIKHYPFKKLKLIKIR